MTVLAKPRDTLLPCSTDDENICDVSNSLHILQKLIIHKNMCNSGFHGSATSYVEAVPTFKMKP
jgi:hypothetical protein